MELTTKKVFRPAEAATVLGISKRQLQKLCAMGQLSSVKLGRRAIGVPASEIDRFINAGGVKM